MNVCMCVYIYVYMEEWAYMSSLNFLLSGGEGGLGWDLGIRRMG